MSVIPYRRDIDGLRAVAVVLVVLSHAHFSLFEGGFVGVDIFFVISGYLITSIMVNEIDQGLFDFKRFYLRRIKRILPALVAVLGVTNIVAYKLLMPGQMVSYAKAQFASLISCSNFFLWRFFGGYWRGSSKEFPLTHTWSLSVEEQFYFVWPILLFFAYTLIPKKNHTKILLVVFPLLLIISQYLVRYPEFAFYMIPARAYELFMGAMAALIVRKPIQFKSLPDGVIVPSLQLFGIGCIIYSSLYYKGGLPYPGINALLPCLGALLLLLPYKYENSLVTRFLSCSSLVGVGKISYSLYLWHWPIFSLLAYTGHNDLSYRLLAFAASFLLSVVSYFAVEQPCRRLSWSLKKAVVMFVVLPLCGSSLFLYLGYSDGFLERYSGAEKKAVKAIYQINNSDRLAQLGKNSPTDSHQENENTVWGVKLSSPIKAMLFGDSHSTAIRPFVEILCEPLKIKGLHIARDSTPFLMNVDFYDRDVSGNIIPRPDKREMNIYWANLAVEKHVKYVFISAFYYSRIFTDPSNPELLIHDSVDPDLAALQMNKDSFYLGLRDTVKFLVGHGITPVVFKDVPFIRQPLSINEVKNMLFGAKLKTEISWDEVVVEHSFEDSVIDRINAEFPKMIVIDPKRLFENLVENGNLRPVLNGIPLYVDSNHLNKEGAIALGHAWIEQYGNPLN